MLAVYPEDLEVELEDLRAQFGDDRRWHTYLLDDRKFLAERYGDATVRRLERLDQLETVATLLRLLEVNRPRYREWESRTWDIALAANERFGSWKRWPGLYLRLYNYATRRFHEYMMIQWSVITALEYWGYYAAKL